jgi:transcriptional regulator with XRE-family HTH domain
MNPDTLKAWRARLALGEAGMSAYLGVPVPTYRKWENGTRTQDASTLRLFAVLGLVEQNAPELHAALIDGAVTEDKPQSAKKTRGKGKVAPKPEKPASARSDAPAPPLPWVQAAEALPEWMKMGS